MRLSFVLAAAAYIGLFIGGQVRALPSEDFCNLHPESPICGGEELPVDPGDCETDPSLCPPPPSGPCAINPALCSPLQDAVLDPGAPEEPPTVDFEGSFRFKGTGFDVSDDTAIALHYDDSTFSFAIEPGCLTPTGTVAAKGRNGTKFQLFLDDASLDAFAEALAFSARLRTGRGGEPLGKTSKVILKKTGDDTYSLKIKVQVIVEDIGEIVYKANLTSTEGSTPSSLRVLCR